MKAKKVMNTTIDIRNGIATIPGEPGVAVDLLAIQKDCVAVFQGTGDQMFADHAESLSLLTGIKIGPQGEFE